MYIIDSFLIIPVTPVHRESDSVKGDQHNIPITSKSNTMKNFLFHFVLFDLWHHHSFPSVMHGKLSCFQGIYLV